MMRRVRTGLLGLGLGMGLLAVQMAAASSASAVGGEDAQETEQASAAASAHARQWGPSIGTRSPVITAPDQSGAPRSLDDLGRANGLLVIFNRSADW